MSFKMKKPSIHQGTDGHKKAVSALKSMMEQLAQLHTILMEVLNLKGRRIFQRDMMQKLKKIDQTQLMKEQITTDLKLISHRKRLIR